MAKPLHLLLPRHEKAALHTMCVEDMRKPDDQMRWLILQEAVKRGLLDKETREPVSPAQEKR